MIRSIATIIIILLFGSSLIHGQRYTNADGRLRIALVKQPFSPNGISPGPNTMANGGIQQVLAKMGAVVRARYPKASAIGFATIPGTDEGGLSLAAVNRMIAGAIRGVKARESRRISEGK